MLSIQDIAQQARVSKTTVSLVINNKSEQFRISPATREKVWEAVRKSGFVPNQYARGFRRRRTGTIGLVVGDVTNHFFSLLEQAIETEARKNDIHLIIASSDEDPATEKEAVQTLLSRSVDGLVVASVLKDAGAHRKLNSAHVPVVYIDRKVEGKGTMSVTGDNRAAAFQLASWFLDRGFKSIGVIGGDMAYSTGRERMAGFRDAFRKFKRPLSGNLVATPGFGVPAGAEGAKTILRKNRGAPEAMLSASLTLFTGAIQALRAEGRGVLEGMAFGTFDDHPFLDYLPFPVVSVRQDCAAMGKSAFNMLLSAIEGKTKDEHRVIESEIITRETR